MTFIHKKAVLEIQLEGDCRKFLKSGKGHAYHISSDGHIEKVLTELDVRSRDTKITVEVPGFSRYSWDY